MQNFLSRRNDVAVILLSFPLGGNVCDKPLDSGLRRAATGLLPSRRIQDFLSINDSV